MKKLVFMFAIMIGVSMTSCWDKKVADVPAEGQDSTAVVAVDSVNPEAATVEDTTETPAEGEQAATEAPAQEAAPAPEAK